MAAAKLKLSSCCRGKVVDRETDQMRPTNHPYYHVAAFATTQCFYRFPGNAMLFSLCQLSPPRKEEDTRALQGSTSASSA
jgi:hypothetical protein